MLVKKSLSAKKNKKIKIPKSASMVDLSLIATSFISGCQCKVEWRQQVEEKVLLLLQEPGYRTRQRTVWTWQPSCRGMN